MVNRARRIYSTIKTRISKQGSDSELTRTKPSGFLSRKIFLVIEIIFFPEAGVAMAVKEFATAWYLREKIRRVSGWEQFTLKQAFLVLMGGISFPELTSPIEFHRLVESNSETLHLDMLPDNRQISLRTKREPTDKLIAVIQSFYFVSSCIIRRTNSLDLSLLELMTFNYLLFGLSMWALRFHKPQDLQEVYNLDIPELNPPARPKKVVRLRFKSFMWKILGLISIIAVIFNLGGGLFIRWLVYYKEIWALFIALSLMASCHFLFVYPLRTVERHYSRDQSWSVVWLFYNICLVIGSLLYVGTRIMMFSLTIRFRHLPASVYTTPRSWTRYIGHIGA